MDMFELKKLFNLFRFMETQNYGPQIPIFQKILSRIRFFLEEEEPKLRRSELLSIYGFLNRTHDHRDIIQTLKLYQSIIIDPDSEQI
jgi:hypothetical protein